MGIFDFALIKEEEKEKEIIPGWAQRMREIGIASTDTMAKTVELKAGGGGTVGAFGGEETKAVGKFDSALKPVLLTTIEEEEKELKDFETTYEALSNSIGVDYNQYIDLQEQLEQLGLDLQEAPKELTWFLQKKFEGVRATHNSLVDKITADTTEQKTIYDSYTAARGKYEKDVDNYNRSINATKKKTEPFIPPDYSPEEITRQLKEGTYAPSEKPDTLRNILGAYATFGKGISMLPKALQVTFMQAVGGGQAAGINDTEEIDTLLKNTKDLDEFVKEAYSRYGSDRIFGIKITELAELPQNLSYSIVSSGAGAAVGIPIAYIPFGGMRALAWVTASAVSGLVCYRATEFQITQSYLEFKNEESIKNTGKGITIEEEKLLKEMFAADAKKYALWEAVPEAVSNLNFWGTLAAPLTKTVGKSLAGPIINKLSRMYLGEFSTEMITQMGQSGIEVKAGMRPGPPPDWTNPRDYIKALQEVAPQTFLLTTIMGGAGATVIETSKAFGKITKSLKAEIGENHPLLKVMEAKLMGMLVEQRGSFSWEDLSKKEIDLLAEKAKKYKSAEEFVESQFESEVYYAHIDWEYATGDVEVIKNPTDADRRGLLKELKEEYKDYKADMPPEELAVRELFDNKGNVYIFKGDISTHEDVEVWLNSKGIYVEEYEVEGAKEKEVKRLTAFYDKVAITPSNIEKAKEDLIKRGVREEFLTPEFMKKYMESPTVQELEKGEEAKVSISEEEASEQLKDLEEMELSAEELITAAKDVEPTAGELSKIEEFNTAREKFEAKWREAREKKRAAKVEPGEVFYVKGNIEVIRNPTPRQFEELKREYRQERRLEPTGFAEDNPVRFIELSDKSLFIFRADVSTHEDVVTALKERGYLDSATIAESFEVGAKDSISDYDIQASMKEARLAEAEAKVKPVKKERVVEPKALGEKFVGKAFRAETIIPAHGAEVIAKMTTAQEKLDYDYGTTGNYTFKEAGKLAGDLGIDLKKVPIKELVWVAPDLKTAEKYGEAKEVKLPEDTIILAKDKEGGSLVLKNAEKYKVEPKAPVVVELKEQVKSNKRKIERLRESIRKAKDTKKDIKTIKQALHDYAKDMPLSIRGKMLTAIKTVANLKDLNEAMVKADQYIETYYRRQYIRAIEKELTAKKIAPKKDKSGILKGKFTAEIQRILDIIKANINGSRSAALEQIDQNAKDLEAGEKTDVAVANELLNMQGIKEMTLADLESTLENIKTLKATGRTLMGEKEAARKEALDEKIDKTLEVVSGKKLEIDEKTGKAKRDTAYKTILKSKWSEKGLLNKAKKLIDKIMNWQFGWDNLLDKLSALDKMSKPYESALSKIGFAIQYARINQINGVEEAIKKLQDIFGTAYQVEGRKAILNKVAENKEEVDLGTFENSKGEKVKLVLNKEQIMKKYMQLEDPTLESTFKKGMLYTEEIEEAIRGAITGEDLAYMDGLREIYDIIYEKVNPIYKDLYGVDLPRNPHYSGRILREGKEIDNIPENLLQVENAIHYASVLNPSLKQRSRTLSPLKYNEATPDILRYVLQMEHFIAFAKPLQELRGIFGNSAVKAVIKQGYGSDIYRKIISHLQDITRDGVDSSNVVALVDKIRGNLVKSILAKPIIGIKQVPSVLAYMTEMPTADFFKGVANFWQNPIKNYRTLMELSPYARERFGKGFERDIHFAMRQGWGNILAGAHKFSDIFFTHIRMGDKLAVVEGMWAKMYSETGGKTMSAGKEKVVEGFRSAERSTERTQPTYTPESLAAGQRGGSYLKLFTAFQNQINKYYRIIADNARNFRYGRGSRIKAASNITLAWVVLPLLFQLIGSAGKIRDKDLWRILLIGPLNDVLVFGQMARSIYGWLAGDTYDYQISPVVSTMKELGKTLQKVAKWTDPTKDMTTEDFVKMVEAAAKTVGQTTGMPTPYGVQLAEAARNKDWRQILYSPYALNEEEIKEKGPVDMKKIYEKMGMGIKKSTGKIPTGIDMNKIYQKMGIKK